MEVLHDTCNTKHINFILIINTILKDTAFENIVRKVQNDCPFTTIIFFDYIEKPII